jgi:hypothetical protein
MALGAGYVNSWVESFTENKTPCLTNVIQGNFGNETNGGADANANAEGTSLLGEPLTGCVFWLVAGLIIGSLRFQKKGQTS